MSLFIPAETADYDPGGPSVHNHSPQAWVPIANWAGNILAGVGLVKFGVSLLTVLGPMLLGVAAMIDAVGRYQDRKLAREERRHRLRRDELRLDRERRAAQ